jgi:hypothetical protein
MPLLQTRQVSASAVPVAPCLRIRKAAVADDGGSPEKRTSGGGIRCFRAWAETVIYREILWQRPNGAAHRKKDDTPPLKGYCQGTKVPSCERSEISAP